MVGELECAFDKTWKAKIYDCSGILDRNKPSVNFMGRVVVETIAASSKLIPYSYGTNNQHGLDFGKGLSSSMVFIDAIGICV